jgi:hypothetical protein
MILDEAKNHMNKGMRSLSSLRALLHVMELAAVVQQEQISRPVEVDWWSLLTIAKRELAEISEPLEEVEVFLSNILTAEKRKKAA